MEGGEGGGRGARDHICTIDLYLFVLYYICN